MKPDRRGPTSPAMPQAPDEVRISIVTVCFNAVATIERTLLSVAGQSHPLVEHLVIDGGSTDGTLEILMPWSSRLAHCVSGPDRGLYDAMNRGLALMRGHLVCMLNADDWFFSPDVCAAVAERYVELAASRRTGEPNYLALYGDFVMWWPQAHLMCKRRAAAGTRWGMRLNHQSLFIHHDVHAALGGYDLSCGLAADFEMVSRMEKAGVAFHYLPRPMTVFGKEGGSGDRRPFLFFRQVLAVQRRYRGLMESIPLCTMGLRNLTGRLLLQWARLLCGRSGEQRILAWTLGAEPDSAILPPWYQHPPRMSAQAGRQS